MPLILPLAGLPKSTRGWRPTLRGGGEAACCPVCRFCSEDCRTRRWPGGGDSAGDSERSRAPPCARLGTLAESRYADWPEVRLRCVSTRMPAGSRSPRWGIAAVGEPLFGKGVASRRLPRTGSCKGREARGLRMGVGLPTRPPAPGPGDCITMSSSMQSMEPELPRPLPLQGADTKRRAVKELCWPCAGNGRGGG